jgi:hypothetical protein
MIPIDPPRENAARRTTAGQRMWCTPTLTGGASEVINHPAGCEGCSKIASHNIAETVGFTLPVNRHRYEVIPDINRQSVAIMSKIEAAIWLYSYILNGYIGGDILFNAGAANNGSQTFRYKVIAGGEGFLTVEGTNPRRLQATVFRVNPNWPFPDPITGSTARLIPDQAGGTMIPCAASVEFVGSCLAGKAKPVATMIDIEDTNEDEVAEFDLVFGDGFDATNATEPADAAFPQDDYFCDVRLEFFNPGRWNDYQAPKEAKFTAQQRIFTTAEVHNLTDSDDDDTRIIWPTLADGAFSVVFDPPLSEPINIVSRLETTGDSVAGYVTTLDLSDLTFTECVVNYYAESVATDTAFIPIMGACRWSKLDLTGSYTHEGGPQHCGKAFSTGLQGGLFHNDCWLPGRCDNFQIFDESPQTMGDFSHLSSLWHRADWIIVQGIPGLSATRNFSLEKRLGASIQSFTGSFRNVAFNGFFPRREEFFGTPLGKLLEYTDGDGNERIALLHGAFYLEPYDFTSVGGPVYTHNANSAPQPGIIAEAVTDWEDGKSDFFPFGGCGATNVYSYQGGAGSPWNRVNSTADSEAYIVAIDVAAVQEPELVSRLRGIYTP